VTLAQVDLADAITRNAAFAGDHPHQVSSLHAVASSNRHKEPRHPTGGTGGCAGTVSLRRPGTCDRNLVRLGLPSLRSLALQQMERRGSQLGGVKFLEQRLERNDLARGDSLCEDGPQFLPHGLFAVVGASFGAMKSER
jgi:hypothetical protein